MDLPQTLRLIIIEADWMERAFTDKVMTEYAAANIEGEVVEVIGQSSLNLKF